MLSNGQIDPEKEVILVLEDSQPNRNILTAILQRLGYEVLASEDGLKGMEHLQRCEKENLRLVAVISDFMMPEMDGLEFLERLRGIEKYVGLPFVFVTAAADKENVLEAAKHAVAGYILKPVSMELIRNKMQEIFPTKQFPSLRSLAKPTVKVS